jgi:hypothetical protein
MAETEHHRIVTRRYFLNLDDELPIFRGPRFQASRRKARSDVGRIFGQVICYFHGGAIIKPGYIHITVTLSTYRETKNALTSKFATVYIN